MGEVPPKGAEGVSPLTRLRRELPHKGGAFFRPKKC